MTSLVEISGYLPARSESIADFLQAYGLSDREVKIYKQYYGFSEIRTDPDLGMAGQLIAAGRQLKELIGQERRVRYVLQARTMPVAAPYPLNPLHEACEALGLRNALAFSLNQQACASALMSVELAGRMLAEDGDPDALALVFVGEKTFTTDAHVLGITAVMGEGVAAVLVRAGAGRDRLLGFASRIRGEFHRGSRMTAEDHERWAADYADGLSEVISCALDRAGMRPADIDLILPHHVNRLSWLKVLRALQLNQKDRIFMDNLPVVGHCFGADAFINYCSARDTGRLKPGDRYVMTAVGLGATFSAMVFEH
ncbi:3-oxoacyl-[acyl-carrier-protein] synthase III C-terminal domain-containing protein [Streptomyces silvisoli]|uniref:3-oxoacyl-[acyl-carrier-protein] synthase III C-terminal domain-containing protein n=1 Tax=Streptomyces silvisoli TaxID=3034235 RepID=A0ABT5ZS60_9ACTN|nr:3-oxoacyl-[acyl-carrier-protein] synthase III C-terminal domain-containing protein [Streptomyces silvisoli]MDF3292663.1 3-oxoacyl-[acyl-carrier-protein] synthase III C-terminal domain-containing protein [Streptomyces silvisoli]